MWPWPDIWVSDGRYLCHRWPAEEEPGRHSHVGTCSDYSDSLCGFINVCQCLTNLSAAFGCQLKIIAPLCSNGSWGGN